MICGDNEVFKFKSPMGNYKTGAGKHGHLKKYKQDQVPRRSYRTLRYSNSLSVLEMIKVK